MCGRYTLRTPQQRLIQQFGLRELGELKARYNIAPTQEVPIVRIAEGAKDESAREWAQVRWGLIPSWSDDPSIGGRMINARGETVASRPAFRGAFRKRRCLIPADGFYEWKVEEGGKQPYFVHLAGDEPFAFAGLWDRWSKGGPVVDSCTIITTEAGQELAELHDRMPVILPPASYAVWLDPEAPREVLESLLKPYEEGNFELRRVNRSVNNPRHDSPRCLDPS